jgi:xylulokinase
MTGTRVLGIDLGTSGAKALLCTPGGQVLARGTARYGISTPRDGWAETDPGHWWPAVRAAVRTATADSPAKVAAIAVTGQMHGVILCTERGMALRPAILWLDRRATAEAEDYRHLPAEQRASFGNAPSPGMAGPLALWLSRHEPEVYRRARWQLQPKDWLRFRLTGVAATDATDASGTLLYDMARGTWAYDAAGDLGLDTGLLPPIRGSADLAGPLLPEAAEELGLVSGTPVAIGCADTAASLLAAEFPDGGRREQ